MVGVGEGLFSRMPLLLQVTSETAAGGSVAGGKWQLATNFPGIILPRGTV